MRPSAEDRLGRSLALVVALLVASCASPGAAPQPRVESPAPPIAPEITEPPPRATPSAARSDAGADRERPTCPAPPAGSLAWLSCDGDRIETAAPIELHPNEAVPREPTKSALAELAALLRRDPELLLIRIEVFARTPGRTLAERKSELASAQARADALFQYLWRHQGISPERLEAVGYPFDPQSKRRAERWPVVFRVAQHSRPRSSVVPPAP